MKSFRELAEAMRKMSDDKMDKVLKDRDMMTFKYEAMPAMAFAKTTEVYISKDNKYFHIEKDENNNKIEDIIKKFNLEEIK